MFEKIGEWFSERGNGIVKILDTASENLGFVLVIIGVTAAFLVLAYASEVIICRKNGTKRKDERLKVKRMTLVSMMSVLAVIIMLFSTPLWFLPGFYKIDASELPVIIGTFALGPVAGITMEFLKIMLNLLLNGTETAFVGEFANFLIGCAFVVPASVCYYIKKTKKSAVIGLAIGTAINAIVSIILNAKVLLPAYAKAFFKSDDITRLIVKGTEKNALITDLPSFIVFAVIPFNLIKCIGVSVLALLIYKKISKMIKNVILQ